MKKILLLILCMLGLSLSAAHAEYIFHTCSSSAQFYYFSCSGGGPPPPLCSNSLDFTASCNSQYIPLVF